MFCHAVVSPVPPLAAEVGFCLSTCLYWVNKYSAAEVLYSSLPPACLLNFSLDLDLDTAKYRPNIHKFTTSDNLLGETRTTLYHIVFYCRCNEVDVRARYNDTGAATRRWDAGSCTGDGNEG